MDAMWDWAKENFDLISLLVGCALLLATVAMVINEPALKAFAAWREQNGLQKAAEIEPSEPVQAEVADVPPAQAAATPSSAMPE